VRALIQHNLLAQGGVTKLYYLGPIFRYERPQRGRYRQFHQVGIEAYGSPGPDIDAEVLALAADFLDAAGIPGTTLELNSVGCPACRPRYRDALRTALAGARTDLCPDCERRFETNPLRILDCKIDTCRDHTRDVPVILDVLCNECHEHLAGVVAGLKRLGVAHVINPHIVRGLDYYTRTAFEFIAGGLGAQNTVLAGGRYDGLVKELGGPATPAIGFAAGIERLLMATTATDAGAAPALIYLALLGDAARAEGMRLALELRRAGVSIVHDYAGRSLKAQLKEANRLGAQVVVILGDEELAQGEAVVRQMADGAQARVALPELAAYLTTR
jgi:histidyl-tRNA synthetase